MDKTGKKLHIFPSESIIYDQFSELSLLFLFWKVCKQNTKIIQNQHYESCIPSRNIYTEQVLMQSQALHHCYH